MQTNQIVPKRLHTFKVFSTTLRPGHEIRVRFPEKWLVILLVSLTLLLNIPPPLQGDKRTASSKTTCYITPKGNDSDTGTLNAPLESPDFTSRKLKTGDTLIILSRVRPQLSGHRGPADDQLPDQIYRLWWHRGLKLNHTDRHMDLTLV